MIYLYDYLEISTSVVVPWLPSFFFSGANRNRGIAHWISRSPDFHTTLSAIIFPDFPEKR